MVAASKLRFCISQLVHKIAKKFQRLCAYQCFRSQAIKGEYWQCCRVEREETGSGKIKMAASKLRLRIYQLVHKIATKFQRLCLYCRDPTIK